MLDDDRLASLFARAGAAFEVPATGPTTSWRGPAGACPTAAGTGDGEDGDADAAEATATATGTTPSGPTAPAGGAPRGRRGPPSPRALGGRLHRGPRWSWPARSARSPVRSPARPAEHDRGAHRARSTRRSRLRPTPRHDHDRTRVVHRPALADKRLPPGRVRSQPGPAAGERGHAAPDHADAAERRRGPARQDRADRFPR